MCRPLFVLLITVVAAAAPLGGHAAAPREPGGLASEARLGLKSANPAPDTDLTRLYGAPGLYSGVRELPRQGLSGHESYSGIFQPLSGRWGSSLETGYVKEPANGMPRYSLAGQLRTALSARHGFSLGLKYTTTERGAQADEFSSTLDFSGANELALADRLTGGSSYELSVNYLYGSSYKFGMSYQLGAAGLYGAPYGLTTGTRTFALTSQHRLSPNWALSYDISAPEPGALLQSPNFGMGLRYRF